MSVLYGPNDILRAPRRIAAKEHARERRLHRCPFDDRHSLLVELDADVALHPRKGVVLTYGEDDIVAGNRHQIDHLAGLLAVPFSPAKPLELHGHQLAVHWADHLLS